jgi:hypothetical protein
VDDLPEGLGQFEVEELSFAVDDGYTIVPLEESVELDEQRLDRLLAPIVPAGAPVASWLLARLARVCAGSLAFEPEVVEICDGGLYVIDFVLRWGGEPVGKIQVQAGASGVALLGVLAIDPDVVIERFVAALATAPQEVAQICVRVRDPAWREDRIAQYGFDGAAFL